MEDKDFIDFKFNGHWASEFNLVAVSTGDRYTTPFYGNFTPNTSTLVGKTGVHKWRTQIGEKVFNIEIAYDNVNLSLLRKIKQWLDPHVISKLTFKEFPYKYYWVSLNEEPQIEFLPFKTEDHIVNGIKIKQGIYKGELKLSFICVDNNSYSEKGTFQNNDYFLLEGSNLLGQSPLYRQQNIYTESFFEKENGDSSNSGISNNRAVYLYNAGDCDANLNLSFDYIPPQKGSPIQISTDIVKLNNNGWKTEVKDFSNVSLDYFGDYKPFIDLLKDTYSINELTTLPKGWEKDWKIVVNSDLNEIYFQNKNNKELLISLNKFNKNQSFLKLSKSNLVDYLKPFPTLLTEVETSALNNVSFNKIYIKSSAQNYRLTNVNFDWKHTYL